MIEIECLYCGEVWHQTYESDYIGCSICKETRLIKKCKIEKSDIYGYRYSPKFDNNTEDAYNNYGEDYYDSRGYTD